MVKWLTAQQANEHLRLVDLEIGNWNQIIDSKLQQQARSWITYDAPKDARQLLNFSRHAASWLPSGEWKLVQFDNSAIFDPTEAAFFGRIVSMPAHEFNLVTSRAFLVKFSESNHAKSETELTIANLIFLLLLFQSHCYIASAGSLSGELLAVQDGSVHFGSRRSDVSGADLLLRRFEREPMTAPRWVMDIIANKDNVEPNR